MATNKKILSRGIRILTLALPLLFLGPIIINSAFKNEKHPLYYFVLVFGICVCLFSMYLIYKGINTLLKSLFDTNEK